MKVIVIGMDNTGKTTLCEELSKLYNLEHLHSLGYKATKEAMLSFMGYNLINDKNVIFERFSYFDEIVYGPVLRKHSKFDLNDDFYYTLLEKNPYIIYCRPPKDVIQKWGEREQMNGIIDNSEKLLERWDALADILEEDGFNVINYDYTMDDPKEILNSEKRLCQ